MHKCMEKNRQFLNSICISEFHGANLFFEMKSFSRGQNVKKNEILTC